MHRFAPCTVIWKYSKFSHSHISQSQWRNCAVIIDTGPCIINVFATRRKNFSQWHRSFQRKLLSHWLKFLRHVAITLVIQGPGVLNYFNSTTKLFFKLFLTQLTRTCIWIIINFIENYRHIICNTNLSKYLPFMHICVYSLRRISDTGITMTSQRHCHTRNSRNNA